MKAPLNPGVGPGPVEAYVRRAWARGPGPLLRIAGSAYGLGLALRHRLYETGVLASRQPPLPVVSVGGITVGGAGKTPVAAAAVAWLLQEGRRVGVATHGFIDEIEVHRRLNPRAPVLGGADRYTVIERLAEAGCDAVVLDDGFQRRQLGRDLDVVVIDAETLARGSVRYLPAGPYRERISELRRAELIVVTRRDASGTVAERVAERLQHQYPRAEICRCLLRPGELVAVNPAAASTASPAPAVGVAAVMKAQLALRQMRERYPTIEHARAFPDHAGLDPATARELLERAGASGIVGTLKDIARLQPAVADATPLWYMTDELVWETDPSEVRNRVCAVARAAAGPSGAPE